MENHMSYLFINNQEIKNDSGNPIPITGTVTNTGGDIAVSNFPVTQTVDGTVALDASSLAALENTTVDINNFPSVQTVDGTMFLDSTNITALQSVTATISNFPATQTVAGTVTLDAASLAALETVNANVTGSVSLDSGSLVSLENVTVNVGSSVEINNDTGNPIPVSGTVALDSDTKAALENTTVNVTFPSTQTVDGTVALDATSLAALETITVDTITNPVTVDTIANPIIVDIINNPVAVTGTFFQATQPISGTVSVNQPVAITDNDSSITVDGTVAINNFPSTQTVDGTVALDTASLAALETITVDAITNPVTIQDGGNSITVDGTVSVNQPVAITDNDSSITVDGTVAINNFPSTQTVDGTIALDATSLAALETTTVDTITNPVAVTGTFFQATQPISGTVTVQDGGNILTVDGSVSVSNFPTTQSVSLDSSSRDALENITATVTFPSSQTVDGTVALDTASLAALETTTVDTITNPVTIQDGGNSITVDGTVSVNQPVAITDNDSSITVDGTVALDASSLAALETVTVNTITNPVTIQDGGGTITVDGIMTPYLIGIAQGLVSGTSSINKFGYRESIPSSYQTIWDGTADYAYAAAGTVLAVADNTASDDNGTVEVQGLDQNYALVTETLTIGGAASSNQFLRVFRARMITANTGTTNVDEVRIKRATTDLAIILAAAGQTLMSLYTIPAGKTGYLIRLQGNVDANNNALFRLISRPLNGSFSFNVKGQFGVFASGFTVDYPIPLVFTEKTDLQVVAKSQNNVGGGASFDLILKDN
jgi:hypothetical protein